ncbi:MAG: hypothetical protein JSV96_07280, partial [Candidatus Aminicenantes bacterium]
MKRVSFLLIFSVIVFISISFFVRGTSLSDTEECVSCHGVGFAKGHYFQFDGLVNLYNEKFARPALEIITMIRSK